MSGAPLIWCAGVRWDDPAGTDRRLVEAISRRLPVHWVDPPRPSARSLTRASTEIDGVARWHVGAPPGQTRWPVRLLGGAIRRRAVERVVTETGAHAVVVANPLGRFPRGDVRRILYVTDDWIAGAGLMGLPAAVVAESVARNRAEADATAVVSPQLAREGDLVLPNGGPPPSATPAHDRAEVAVLIGQLNERLDLSLLEAVTAAGVPVRVIGRRVDRDPAFSVRLDRWLQHPLVHARGPVAAHEVPLLLADAGVGLTPYADTAFNRASSPLKTFDYLAAGLPVVSSDLPASRWFGTPHVAVAGDPEAFVEAVRTALTRRNVAGADAERRTLAAAHTWERRAGALLDLVDGPLEAGHISRRRGSPTATMRAR